MTTKSNKSLSILKSGGAPSLWGGLVSKMACFGVHILWWKCELGLDSDPEAWEKYKELFWVSGTIGMPAGAFAIFFWGKMVLLLPMTSLMWVTLSKDICTRRFLQESSTDQHLSQSNLCISTERRLILDIWLRISGNCSARLWIRAPAYEGQIVIRMNPCSWGMFLIQPGLTDGHGCNMSIEPCHLRLWSTMCSEE